jgi:hypothetical protein
VAAAFLEAAEQLIVPGVGVQAVVNWAVWSAAAPLERDPLRLSGSGSVTSLFQFVGV